MRVVPKDIIRLAAGLGEEPVEIEIRVRQDRWAGWEATALLYDNGGSSPTALGRVFRSRDRYLAVGKMIAWVRRRYGRAQPVIQHQEGAGRCLAFAGSVIRPNRPGRANHPRRREDDGCNQGS